MFKILETFLDTAKAVRAGEIVDGRLNPIHLFIATTGYRIQFETLHIPDHLAFFSSSPPRLQAHQATWFIVLWYWLCPFAIITGVLMDILLRCLMKRPATLEAFVVAAVLFVYGCTFVWILMCNGYRRDAGYQWEDWKVRQD
jgi:hypothetical protein